MTPGQAAFEAWKTEIPRTHPVMLKWEDMNAVEQRAWEGIAKAGCKRVTPGEAAYNLWVDLVPGSVALTWERMPQSGKDGWEEIARAAIDACYR